MTRGQLDLFMLGLKEPMRRVEKLVDELRPALTRPVPGDVVWRIEELEQRTHRLIHAVRRHLIDDDRSGG